MDEKVRDGEDTIARSPRRPLPRILQRSAGRRGNCPLRVDGQRSRLQENAIAAIRDAIRDSRIATFDNKLVWVCASPEELFRLQFAQGRVAQLDLAPTPAAFVSTGSKSLDAGAIVRRAPTVGDRGYKRTVSQPFVMLYVIHV